MPTCHVTLKYIPLSICEGEDGINSSWFPWCPLVMNECPNEYSRMYSFTIFMKISYFCTLQQVYYMARLCSGPLPSYGPWAGCSGLAESVVAWGVLFWLTGQPDEAMIDLHASPAHPLSALVWVLYANILLALLFSTETQGVTWLDWVATLISSSWKSPAIFNSSGRRTEVSL